MSGDHPNYYIIGNGQNTEKSPGDPRRLAVTQTPVKNHRLSLMWKALMSYDNNTASVLENDAQKLLWDFDIHTDLTYTLLWPCIRLNIRKMLLWYQSDAWQEPIRKFSLLTSINMMSSHISLSSSFYCLVPDNKLLKHIVPFKAQYFEKILPTSTTIVSSILLSPLILRS